MDSLPPQLARRRRRDGARQPAEALDLAKLALVARVTDNAVVITDDKGRTTWVNDAFTRITGYTLADAAGRTPGSLLQCDSTDTRTVHRLRSAIAAREPVQAEILNRAKDGRLYWLQLDVQPLREAPGALPGFIAVQTDITPLVTRRERLATLLRTLPIGVLALHRDGRIVDANPEAERLLQRPRQALLGLDPGDAVWRVVDEDGRVLPPGQLTATHVLSTGQGVRDALVGLDGADGPRRWLRVSAAPLKGPDGTVTGAVTCLLDTTEASDRRRLMALTVSAAGLGTWEWQIESGRLRFDDRWHGAGDGGDTAAASRSLHWRRLVHPDDLSIAMQRLEQHLDHRAEPFQCEVRARAHGGGWAWRMVAGAVIDQDNDGRPRRVAGVHFDITQRKQLEQALSRAALTDVLTQLPNRQALVERLRQCRERAARLPGDFYAVLFMDLDRFKQVNDSLGHDAGDELLRQMAARMQRTLRADDDVTRCAAGATTAARIGGDEFVVLLDRLRQPGDAVHVAQRLLETLGQPYRIAGSEVRSSASIGIVTSDRADLDPSSLLRDADAAMYEAKRRGRAGCVVFDGAMQARLHDARTLAVDLQRALAQGHGIGLVYDAIVELASGRMVGVDAQARWQHPQRGTLADDALSAAAEACGLGAQLGRVLLQRACRDAVAWRATLGDRAPATVALRLGRAQLQGVGLHQQVIEVLRETGLPASVLRLEIAAEIACSDAELIASLVALRTRGVGVVLAEIGNGGPHLASLDQLPMDALKLTPAFVQRLATSAYHGAAIDAAVRVGHALQVAVVAAGVERHEQVARLRQLGCTLAQGPLFGPPLHAPAPPPACGDRA